MSNMICVETCQLCSGAGAKPTTACGRCGGVGHPGCGLCSGAGKVQGARCSRCWGRGTVPAGFVPADVVLRVPPLTDTMGRTVIECAAALLVATLALRGNTWRPVLWSEVQEVAKAATEAGEPTTGEDSAARFLSTICRNPFLRPHFAGLLAGGFATRDEATDSIALTEQGIAALAKWVNMPQPAPAPATAE